MFPAGTTNCSGAAPGGEAAYEEAMVTPGLRDGRTTGAQVETTQIAPTILSLLGLNPYELQAVQIEHTQVLPGLR